MNRGMNRGIVCPRIAGSTWLQTGKKTGYF
jgi:hypothetical protein